MTDEPQTTTDETDSEQCCDNPSISKVPSRRFSFPDQTSRETHAECANCDATHS